MIVSGNASAGMKILRRQCRGEVSTITGNKFPNSGESLATPSDGGTTGTKDYLAAP